MTARIAIAGGGLGGTAAAIMLARAGYRVDVYEQAPRLERIGAGINLTPNVTNVFARLGLLDRMLEIALVPRESLNREWDTGEITYSLAVPRFPDLYGAPHVIMHRGDLQAVLTAALPPGVLHLGKCLADLDDAAGGLRLVFADGSVAEADILIGADGLNSRVRELLLGPERPTYTGAVAHRSIFPTALLGGLAVHDMTKWWADDRYIMVYFLTHRRDEIYFVTGVPHPDWEGPFVPVESDLDQMRACFDGFHPTVRAIVQACPAASAWPVLERAPFPLWSRGRIVLLGDSCHPMKPHMGQGAAMAIEDAVLLARSIAAANDNFADAFRMYEAARFERTSKVQHISAGHEWMRHGSEADWLYGYDAWNVALPAMAGGA